MIDKLARYWLGLTAVSLLLLISCTQPTTTPTVAATAVPATATALPPTPTPTLTAAELRDQRATAVLLTLPGHNPAHHDALLPLARHLWGESDLVDPAEVTLVAGETAVRVNADASGAYRPGTLFVWRGEELLLLHATSDQSIQPGQVAFLDETLPTWVEYDGAGQMVRFLHPNAAHQWITPLDLSEAGNFSLFLAQEIAADGQPGDSAIWWANGGTPIELTTSPDSNQSLTDYLAASQLQLTETTGDNGQHLLTLVDANGVVQFTLDSEMQWHEAVVIGDLRTLEDGSQQIHIGENVWLDAPNKFDAQYLQVTQDGIRYHAPGLKLMLNEARNGWMVDMSAPVLPGTIDCLFCMDDELKLNEEAAREQYRRTILAFVNSPINAEYRQHIFGSSNPITLDQLPLVATPNGDQRLIPIFDAQSNEHWPNILLRDSSNVNLTHHTLIDYFEPSTIAVIQGNRGIDVTGIKVIVARTYDWQENINGIRDLLSSDALDGPSNRFGTPYSRYGFGIGKSGEMVLFAYSQELAPSGGVINVTNIHNFQLGGKNLSEISPYIATAHLGSIVKVYETIPSGIQMPLFPEPFGGYMGVTDGDMPKFVPPNLFN